MMRAVLYINGSANDMDSLVAAILLCRRVDGRLSVIHPLVDSVAEAERRTSTARQTTNWRHSVVLASRSQAARKAFDTVCHGLDFATYREIDEPLMDTVGRLGLVHDVTILERVSQEEGPKVLAFNAALFDAGSAVLVAPPKAPSTLGESVAVVWSGRVQSAHAVRAALPLLVAATQVHIITNRANVWANAGELAGYLECYGVTAERHSFDGSNLTARARGRAVLELVQTIAADTLVMGAYGENRLDAIFGLGRATRKVVTASPVPVLLQS